MVKQEQEVWPLTISLVKLGLGCLSRKQVEDINLFFGPIRDQSLFATLYFYEVFLLQNIFYPLLDIS